MSYSTTFPSASAHALHLSCAITALLPRGARISMSSLRAPIRRAAVTQVLVFAVAGLAAFLPTGVTEPAVELIGLLSIAGIALVVITLERSR
ncbi:MAG: hypothetical protein M3548_17520 [Actinomycetota bacterium]|nr:hypothetical protein [Actinomycetota bacterium]